MDWQDDDRISMIRVRPHTIMVQIGDKMIWTHAGSRGATLGRSDEICRSTTLVGAIKRITSLMQASGFEWGGAQNDGTIQFRKSDHFVSVEFVDDDTGVAPFEALATAIGLARQG